MENRLKIYCFFNEKEDEMTLESLVEKLKAANGFMITVSILTNDSLEHSVITENFRKIDMIPSHKKIKDLIIKELETEDEFGISDDKSF